MNGKALADPGKAAYRRWYAKNKAEFNKKRREKYKKDSNYREKAIANTHSYRERGPATVMEDSLYRELNGKNIEVFRISTVGQQIGRSVQAIRQWERSGIIPKPLFDGGHRMYTKKQITLMKRVVKASDKWRYRQEKYSQVMGDLSIVIHERWSM